MLQPDRHSDAAASRDVLCVGGGRRILGNASRSIDLKDVKKTNCGGVVHGILFGKLVKRGFTPTSGHINDSPVQILIKFGVTSSGIDINT